MSNIEIRFNKGKECQKIFIPASTGKKRIHLVFAKMQQTVPNDVETIIVDNKIWYECKLCGKRFDNRGYCRIHVRKVHKKVKDNLCNFCGKSFATSAELSVHMQRVHLDRPYQCELCRRRFDTEEKLKIHHAGQHEGRPRRYQCGNCHKSFQQMAHLKSHVLSHTEQKHFKCAICSLEFVREESLKLHMKKKHFEYKLLECDKCPKKYKSKRQLTLHQEQKHNVPQVKSEENENSEDNRLTPVKTESLFKERQTEFICDVCGKIFTKKEFLTNHARIHSGEKPFECDVCKMTFRQRGHLLRHSRLHTGERNYQCEYCDKKFTRQEHLKTHVNKIHNVGEPQEISLVNCPICFQTYKSSSLKKHLKTHESQIYKCADCDGEFRSELLLKNHVIDGHHFLGPVRTCPICFKVFSRCAHVRRHMINIHSAKSYNTRCSICGEHFKTEQAFQKHVVKAHGLVGQTKKKEMMTETDSEEAEIVEEEDVDVTEDSSQYGLDFLY